jgi:FlaA1/EpsC-like NDP-sugar epimerase
MQRSASSSLGYVPGEKLYEELLADAEQPCKTPHPKLRIAMARPVDDEFLDKLRPWLDEPSLSDVRVRVKP